MKNKLKKFALLMIRKIRLFAFYNRFFRPCLGDVKHLINLEHPLDHISPDQVSKLFSNEAQFYLSLLKGNECPIYAALKRQIKTNTTLEIAIAKKMLEEIDLYLK